MPLKEQLQQDLRDALRGGDETRKSTIRYLNSAIRNAEIDAGHELNDHEIATVIQRQVKQRRDSIEEFRKGNRQDLVDKESAEMAILQAYLPEQLSREEIAAEARKVIQRVGASGPGDKGKVMGPLMADLRGKVDGALVNAVVTELLSA